MDGQPSLKHLEQKAENGDGSAACTLGNHYRTGNVISQDWNMAFRWHSRGAALGNREAENNLGTFPVCSGNSEGLRHVSWRTSKVSDMQA